MYWGGTIALKDRIRARHLSLRQFISSLSWDNLIMDVLSLAPGYLSLCTYSAGRV